MNRPPGPFRRTQILTMAAVAAVLVAVAGAFMAGQAGNRQPAPGPDTVEAVAEKLAAGQALDRAELNAELIVGAEAAHGHLAHVLQELASAVPVLEATSPTPATVGEVDGWKRDLVRATSALEAVGEGTSEQTLTREAFAGATELLRSAATDYELVLTAPADEREALAAAVAERRDAAVRLWQAGAAQLDTLAIESGEGHVHVFLAPNGDPDAVPIEFREAEDQH